MEVLSSPKTGKLMLAVSIAAMFGSTASAALANTESLVEKLYQKGVLTEAEYNEMRAEAAAERREQDEKTDDANKLSGKFKDGFKWTSKDGQHAIQPAGRIQLDYRSFDHDGSADTFDIRRVYFGVKGQLYNDWTFEATSNLDGGALEYGFLDYKWNDAVQVRMGAFKYMFSIEEITSSRFTDFQERSFVNSWVPGKDVGIMIHGQPRKNVFSYALGVANGEGKNSNDKDPKADGKDLIGRIAYNFAPMAGIADGVLHLGANYATGSVAASGSVSQSTEGRGLKFFSASVPMIAGLDEIDRTRSGVEAVIAYGPFKLQSEFLTANLEADGGTSVDVDTSYVSANWLITGEKYLENYSINGMKGIAPANSIENGGMGAWELGVRFSQFEAGSLFPVSSTSTNKADATTVGLTWIPNSVTRFILNWVETDFDTPIAVGNEMLTKETAVTLRTQIYF